VFKIGKSVQELLANPVAVLADLEELSSGQARLRSDTPLSLFMKNGTVTNGSFELNIQDKLKPKSAYRVLLRENFGSKTMPINVPVYRSRDLPMEDASIMLAYRICDDADLEFLRTQGVETRFTYKAINTLLEPLKADAGLKVLKANEEDDRVRLSFEKEITGPNIKGKVLIEGRPSESYDVDVLLRATIEDVDFFGAFSLAEWFIGDLVEDAEAMLNHELNAALPAMPSALADRSVTVTLVSVAETGSAIEVRPSIGVRLQ
jgi:hypothetical protein